MKKYLIHLEDWQRIVFGEAPPTFFFEILIRTLIIIAILLVSMRLMGRRMASQLSRIEMAAMVSLAGAIGVPIQVPDRGILPAVVIAIVVVSVERLISYFASRNQKFEQVTQDDVDILLEDSVLKMDAMQRTRITRDRLFAQLRSEGIKHLGSVSRVYMEANGFFSVVRREDVREEVKPGVCILPPWDEEFVRELKVADFTVCMVCGKPEEHGSKCPNCGGEEFEKAVIEEREE
ncbi:DUF421 domain-containing protein [Desertivirga xinjiangensis]|uniref:DUF421 domain-containing protein n=1 Tax=Desertivirga xinjiangensis TaxID=539206 RepID=UPI00210E02E5|nr:YetF domain-containing protein [Pedobacter xinjiangensis]